MAYQRILTIQDISCVGQCSLTVALPILSACGIETAILPSAVLSTHTAGFTGFTVRDLTEDIPNMDDVFFDNYDPRGKRQFNWGDLRYFSDENTSEADYVWLPIMFDEDGNPYIEWRRVWTVDEFKK